MVFHRKDQFMQFPHCKFRENIVKVLRIPSHFPINEGSTTKASKRQHIIVAVNKFGKVGLYNEEKFTLLHTYCLDLSVPPKHSRHQNSSSFPFKSSNDPIVTLKCERTHLITDATFVSDCCSLVFATTKNFLQWYDIGEIQRQDIGLDIFPNGEFLPMVGSSSFSTTILNMGHVESHRLVGLSAIPTCLEYIHGKLIIGDVSGIITIISIPDPKTPLGRRKIRGRLHTIIMSDLLNKIAYQYQAHQYPVTDILFLQNSSLIFSCSKDKKFSIFVKDITGVVDNTVLSVIKGVNTIAHSSELKMLATGSDDYAVRLFSQFIMKMPQMELHGHRSVVHCVQFLRMETSTIENNVILLSYSADLEIRAWDPLTFICLQSIYLSFSVGSTIMCKVPEFARNSIILLPTADEKNNEDEKVETNEAASKGQSRCHGRSNKKKKRSLTSKNEWGTLVLLYCNSYARIILEKENSSQQSFDYDSFIREFNEQSKLYETLQRPEQKHCVGKTGSLLEVPSADMKMEGTDCYEDEVDEVQILKRGPDRANKPVSVCKTPPTTLTKAEESEIESKLNGYREKIVELRRTLKDGQGSMKEEETSPLTSISMIQSADISAQAIKKYCEFKLKKDSIAGSHNLLRHLTYGQAFNYYSTMKVKAIDFQKRFGLIPKGMRKGAMETELADLFRSSSSGKEVHFKRKTSAPPISSLAFAAHRYSRKQNKDLSLSPLTSTLKRCKNPKTKNYFAVIGQKLQNAYEDEPDQIDRQSKQAFREIPPVLEESEEEKMNKSFDFS